MSKLKSFDVLLMETVNDLNEEVSTLSILESLYSQTGKRISIGFLLKSLLKLWNLGFLDSEKAEGNIIRQGRRKRIFVVTAYGNKSLKQISS